MYGHCIFKGLYFNKINSILSIFAHEVIHGKILKCKQLMVIGVPACLGLIKSDDCPNECLFIFFPSALIFNVKYSSIIFLVVVLAFITCSCLIRFFQATGH